MSENIRDIFSRVDHRPWQIPSSSWKYYQEWNDALFLHWEVPLDILERLVPKQLEIDRFEGKCYVSIVAFKMEKIRPRFLPSLSAVSDFYEINVRTYVKVAEKTGVYFLNMEAGKSLSAFLCRTISGLPYEKATILRTPESYASMNAYKNFKLEVRFSVASREYRKSMLDSWLTERYSLYAEDRDRIFRYEIHHHQWGIEPIDITQAHVDYKLGDLHLTEKDICASHYSKGVRVVAWQKEIL